MAKSLPTVVYVRWSELYGGDAFLEAHVKQFDHAEMGETRIVGRYELKETKRVTGAAQIRNA